MAEGIPIRKTKAAAMGVGYVAANGSKIENYGERVLKGVTDDGPGVAMAVQVADVKRPLGSVYRMSPLVEDNGKYMFNIWMRSGVKEEGRANNERDSIRSIGTER